MNKYIKAIFYNLIFFTISTLAFLILTPLAIRIMGDEFYGLWSILNAILVFSRIGNLGIGVVVIKFASEKSGANAGANAIITAGALIAIPMAMVSCGILILTRGWIIPRIAMPQALQEEFNQSIVIASLCLFPQYLSLVANGYLLSQLKNGLSRFIELVIQITSLSGAIIVAKATHNLKFMVSWMLIMQVLKMICLYYFVFRITGYLLKFNEATFRRMIKFSLFNFLETLAINIFQQLDRVSVGFMLGPTAAGAYAVGTSVSLRLSMITGQVTDVMVPYASRKHTENDHTTLFENFRNMTRLINVVLAVMGGLLVVWMKEILTIWISSEYAINYGEVFCLLVLAYVILSLSRPGHQTLTGMGHVRFMARIYFATSLLMIAGIYLLSPRYGLIGAAIAKLSSILLLIFNLYAYYQLRGRISLKKFIADNGWAISFTFAGYLLVLFGVPIILRILFSILIISLALIWCWRDNFIRGQIKLILDKLITNINKSK